MIPSIFRLYKLIFYSTIFKMEVDFIDKTQIEKPIYLKAREISNAMHSFQLEIKRRNKAFNEIFEDTSNEKIFAMMSVINKMLMMTESQCLEFEKELELEDVDNLIHTN